MSTSKLTDPQRACLVFHLWLETREGPKPKWSFDVRVERNLLDQGMLDRVWVSNPKTGTLLPKVTVTESGRVALAA